MKLLKNLITLLSSVLFIIISSCSAKAGVTFISKRTDPSLISGKGQVLFSKNIRAKYIVTFYPEHKKTSDIIFYFHGLGKNELEWAEKDGFGRVYYETVTKGNFSSPPVVSITLGPAYFFLEDAPAPYNTDLESLFIKEIVPYFQDTFNRKGKVYLIGHSMGGFNALTLSLRNPDKFHIIAAMSPYTAPISPFSKEFEEKGKELNMPNFQVNMLKMQLTNAFKTEKKWNEYNPFYLVEHKKYSNPPFIILSRATNDLPGFNWSINEFADLLNKKDIPNISCEASGDHRTSCGLVFKEFLNEISQQ